MKNEVF
jgi:glycerophosphoryl diester phosphodiesterase